MEVQSDQFREALMDLLASPQVAVSSLEIYEIVGMVVHWVLKLRSTC